MSLPSVNITVADNGSNASIELPQQNVQVKIGCAIGGTVNVPVASSNPATFVSEFTGGPLVEAAALTAANRGTVIAVSIPIVTPGTVTSVIATVPGSSTSAVTVASTGDGIVDTFYVMVQCATGGTIGTNGIQIQVSLDAGRSFGASINLGLAVNYIIPNTGLRLEFGAGIMVAGDYWRFSTTGPKGNDAGIQAAVAALLASQYAVAGWGSMHLVGESSATTVTNVQSYIQSATSQYVYTRIISESRDALAPTAWGGSGETEVTWMASLATAFSATSAKRVCVGAGYYNTPTVLPNPVAGTPSYRRPLSWSDSVRRVNVAPQRKGGAVSDGALSTIVVNPVTDPGDGFIYHDERVNPGLDAARFMTAITWPKYQGFYICHENLMSPTGSQFTELVLGNVIDVACDIGYATAVQEIGDDLRLTASGSLLSQDATVLQNRIDQALSINMTNVSMVSDAYSSVSQTENVRSTHNIPIAITVNPKGYVNSISEVVNLQS